MLGCYPVTSDRFAQWRSALPEVVQTRRAVLLTAAMLSVLWLVVYLSTVSPTVNFIDSGELITAAYEPGIAHPPGYPLYILMGYVVSHTLGGEVAWRVNVLSAIWGAAATGMMCLLLYELISYISAPRPQPPSALSTPAPNKQRRPARPSAPRPQSRLQLPTQHAGPALLATAIAGACLFAAGASFWSRTSQAKLYTLHYFFMLALLFFALKLRQAYEIADRRRANLWATALAATLGLAFTNHLMTSLLVPVIATLVLAGHDWRSRSHILAGRWHVLVPALLAPLLLYLYLPLRASQDPLMNWGSPDNWGDFWRHVTGWQYRAYLFQQPDVQAARILEYALDQWGWLTWPVLLISLAGAYFLARRALPVFFATLLLVALTVLFAIAYSISEIEPYLVPAYAVLVLWVTVAVTAPLSAEPSRPSPAIRANDNVDATRRYYPHHRHTSAIPLILAPALLMALALLGAALNYPRQDRSEDRLAERFALNVFNTLPPNSILLTDYWDFYAPTYYLQDVQHIRRDIAIVDTSLVRYPWYTHQLEKKYPWLIARSQDIVKRYRTEQLKWVNGQPFDANLLTQLYFELLNSFVERNYDRHAVFVLFMPCDPRIPPALCETNLVAPAYYRQPVGLVHRLLRQPPPPGQVPPEPQFDLRGITHDRVPMDEFARANAQYYVRAFQTLAQLYAANGHAEQAQRMAQRAAEVQAALETR